MNLDQDTVYFWTKIAGAFHLLGIFSAVQAIMTARTSQGAIAWAVSLITFPYLGVPLFWIFGRDRFFGYTVSRMNQDLKVNFLRRQQSPSTEVAVSGVDPLSVKVFEDLAEMRFRSGNSVKLLVNGKATFDAIFEGIDAAKEYLLVQFFIVKDDDLGRRFQKKLIEAARRGVRVYFLYDEVGSHALPKTYLRECLAEKIDIRAFKTTKGFKNRFQLNFRNHRKIVISDGRVAYVGGHNVGDEYLGKDPKLGFWRDTHIEIRGPAVSQVQVSFAEDWNWSAPGSLPAVTWDFDGEATQGMHAMVLPTGPADELDSCGLFFLEAINSARHRLWIATPYFVPDPQIISALQLAAMRGVDVRILLPEKPDHWMSYLASFSYLKETLPWNIKLHRYHKGFMHQKTLLVDEHLSAVGTANFDNRSFRLNFEITLVVANQGFNASVERMLLADFAESRLATLDEIDKRSFPFRLAVRVCRLLAPIL